ncbi:outer membrane protein [Rhodanobacter sp. Si-c]|uniref:Outer membrane protein n=1 Tax=Rhodanobacter lycopersici TaxID=3162487 RepID=A0ABV3QF97_9GAMM
MNKRIQMTIAAVLLAAASSGAMAADDGAFFINGNLGQSRYHDSGFGDKTDTAGAVRLGYDWNAGAFSFGAEGGYVDLGKASGMAYVPYGGVYGISAKTSGWLLGGNFKYHFANGMYLSSRMGYFRSTFDTSVSGIGSQDFSGNGAYAGVGFGYDFNRNFSLGVSYDRYHGRASIYDEKVGENIDMFSAFAEFRF